MQAIDGEPSYLFLAVKQGSVEVMRVLLEAGGRELLMLTAPTRVGSPPITTDHHYFVGMWWVGEVGGGGGGCRGTQGVPAVVSRGSRTSRVTFRTPPTGSPQTHLGVRPDTVSDRSMVRRMR
jgi:hypothetical protein